MIGRPFTPTLLNIENDGSGTQSASIKHERPAHQRHILIVDDEKDIAEMFGYGLRRAGLEVEVFSDPMEALSKYKIGRYDLVLLDIRMPGMNGFELCSAIRQLEQVKVCFISAFDIQGDMNQVLPVDASCIIRKPISIRGLVERVEKELEVKQKGGQTN